MNETVNKIVSKIIDTVVLAAGCSARTGNKNKLLLNFRNKTLASYAINAARNSKSNCVHIVTGYQNHRLVTTFENTAVHFIYNPQYRDGIANSISRAVQELYQKVDGLIFSLADMPWVTSNHFDMLIDAFNENKVCAMHYLGQRGHPILFPRNWFDDLTKLRGDKGAKNLLDDANESITVVEAENNSILRDIDRLEDFI